MAIQSPTLGHYNFPGDCAFSIESLGATSKPQSRIGIFMQVSDIPLNPPSGAEDQALWNCVRDTNGTSRIRIYLKESTGTLNIQPNVGGSWESTSRVDLTGEKLLFIEVENGGSAVAPVVKIADPGGSWTDIAGSGTIRFANGGTFSPTSVQVGCFWSGSSFFWPLNGNVRQVAVWGDMSATMSADQLTALSNLEPVHNIAPDDIWLHFAGYANQGDRVIDFVLTRQYVPLDSTGSGSSAANSPSYATDVTWSDPAWLDDTSNDWTGGETLRFDNGQYGGTMTASALQVRSGRRRRVFSPLLREHIMLAAGGFARSAPNQANPKLLTHSGSDQNLDPVLLSYCTTEDCMLLLGGVSAENPYGSWAIGKQFTGFGSYEEFLASASNSVDDKAGTPVAFDGVSESINDAYWRCQAGVLAFAGEWNTTGDHRIMHAIGELPSPGDGPDDWDMQAVAVARPSDSNNDGVLQRWSVTMTPLYQGYSDAEGTIAFVSSDYRQQGSGGSKDGHTILYNVVKTKPSFSIEDGFDEIIATNGGVTGIADSDTDNDHVHSVTVWNDGSRTYMLGIGGDTSQAELLALSISGEMGFTNPFEVVSGVDNRRNYQGVGIWPSNEWGSWWIGADVTPYNFARSERLSGLVDSSTRLSMAEYVNGQQRITVNTSGDLFEPDGWPNPTQVWWAAGSSPNQGTADDEYRRRAWGSLDGVTVDVIATPDNTQSSGVYQGVGLSADGTQLFWAENATEHLFAGTLPNTITGRGVQTGGGRINYAASSVSTTGTDEAIWQAPTTDGSGTGATEFAAKVRAKYGIEVDESRIITVELDPTDTTAFNLTTRYDTREFVISDEIPYIANEYVQAHIIAMVDADDGPATATTLDFHENGVGQINANINSFGQLQSGVPELYTRMFQMESGSLSETDGWKLNFTWGQTADGNTGQSYRMHFYVPGVFLGDVHRPIPGVYSPTQLAARFSEPLTRGGANVVGTWMVNPALNLDPDVDYSEDVHLLTITDYDTPIHVRLDLTSGALTGVITDGTTSASTSALPWKIQANDPIFVAVAHDGASTLTLYLSIGGCQMHTATLDLTTGSQLSEWQPSEIRWYDGNNESGCEVFGAFAKSFGSALTEFDPRDVSAMVDQVAEVGLAGSIGVSASATGNRRLRYR